jgi:hypothetical protein
MTDFKVKVLDKLSSNFDKKEIKQAEDLTNKLFEEEMTGGAIAVEELLMSRIKSIIEESGVNLDEIEEQLDDC